MSDPVSGETSVCFPGDEKGMGSITSSTKTDKNQDFSAEGVTKGVEDDIPDDDCILSENESNIETTCILDKLCDDSVKDDGSFRMKNTVADLKEKSLPKCVTVLQDQQSGDHIYDISAENVPTTTNLLDKDSNKKNMTGESTVLHFDKSGKSFPNRQDNFSEIGLDSTVTKCQIKEESSPYISKASGDEKSHIGTDVSKAQSEIASSNQPEERSECSHSSNEKNSENHIFKKSVIIESIMHILNRNQKQLENNISMDEKVTTNGKSQTVDSKRTNKGYFQSFSSFLSVAPSDSLPSNSEGRKRHGSSAATEKVVPDAVKVQKHLKSGVERVISQLEKLQQALYVSEFDTENLVASKTSESLKNQIKGMMTAVTQMYHIVYYAPLNNLSFLDTLNQMATQLRKVEEEILKSRDSSQDPVTYFLHFQETLDSLRKGGAKDKDSVSHET